MPPGMIPIARSHHERVKFPRLVTATSMHMSSGKRPEDFTKAVHLTSLFGQDRIPVDARRLGANGQTAAEEFSVLPACEARSSSSESGLSASPRTASNHFLVGGRERPAAVSVSQDQLFWFTPLSSLRHRSPERTQYRRTDRKASGRRTAVLPHPVTGSRLDYPGTL